MEQTKNWNNPITGRRFATPSNCYTDDFDLRVYEGILWYFRELFSASEDIVDLWPCFSYNVLPAIFPYDGKNVVVIDFHCIDFFADLLLCYQDLDSKKKMKHLLCKYMYEIEERSGSPSRTDACEIYRDEIEKLQFDDAAARSLLVADDQLGDKGRRLAEKIQACAFFMFVHELCHNNILQERLRSETTIYEDAWKTLQSQEFLEENPELKNEKLRREVYCDICALIFCCFDDTVVLEYLSETFHMTKQELVVNCFFAMFGALFYRMLEGMRTGFLLSDEYKIEHNRIAPMMEYAHRSGVMTHFLMALMEEAEHDFYSQQLEDVLLCMKKLTLDTCDIFDVFWNDLKREYKE